MHPYKQLIVIFYPSFINKTIIFKALDDVYLVPNVGPLKTVMLSKTWQL